MKTLAHIVGLAFALVLTGLGSGCASKPTASYHQPAQDFEVVESSAKRPLTNSELAEVRASVASYLEREGATDGGDYFLKVYLAPENVDAESEWVVVRFTRYTAQRVAVVGAYPYDDLMYSPYYSYDIYPYGYGCVSRISFQYYVDPFYGRHYYYYPRYGYGGHKDGPHGHDTADNHDHGGGKPGNPPGDGNDHGPKPPSRPKYGAYGGRPGVPLAENENPRPRDNLNNGSSSVPGLPQAPRVTPTRWTPPAGNVDYRPVAEKPAVRRPSNVTPAPRSRPEGAPTSAPNRNLNPNQDEARINPTPTNRPAPGYRPAAQQQPQRNYQPASQPARNYQSSPASSPRPSYQPAPAQSSPPPSNNSRQGGDSQKQDNLR